MQKKQGSLSGVSDDSLGWKRQRSLDELNQFINRRLAMVRVREVALD